MPSATPQSRLFSPGEVIPRSGVYRVQHVEHREDHPVLAIKGEIFPSCRKCRGAVRFRLWMEVDYVVQDWDLTGPQFKLVS